MAVEEAGDRVDDLAGAALVWLGIKAGSTGPDVAAAPAVAAAVAGFIDSLPGVVPEAWTPAQRQGATMLAARIIRRRNSLSGVEAFSGDAGGAVYVSRNDPDVALLLGLGAYKKPRVG